MNGASAALTVSSIPWAGPVGAVRVSVMDGVPVLNPSDADIAASDLTLFYAGTEDRTLMIEAQAMKPAGRGWPLAHLSAQPEAVCVTDRLMPPSVSHRKCLR